MHAPQIVTAVPERRYHIGTFSAVILGEVESADGLEYRYVLALVPEGESEPVLYITCRDVSDQEPAGASTIVEVLAESGERAFGPDDRWRDLDAFAGDALAMVQRVMGLTDEEPARLV